MTLNLWDNKIGKEGVDALAEVRRKVCTFIYIFKSLSFFQALKVNTTLVSLDVGRNKIGDDAVVSLCKVKNQTERRKKVQLGINIHVFRLLVTML